MVRKLSPELQRQLRALELLADSEIDTTEYPADPEWENAVRGIWNPIEYKSRHYDIRAIANTILTRLWTRGIKPSNMALNKLTWFIYERALVEFGVLLSEARVEAWDHGPVFREIYSPSKEYGSEPITSLLKGFSRNLHKMVTVEASLDPQTSHLIDVVLTDVGDSSAAILRELSHEHAGPWDMVWNSNRKTSAGMVISPHVIIASASARAQKNDR